MYWFIFKKLAISSPGTWSLFRHFLKKIKKIFFCFIIIYWFTSTFSPWYKSAQVLKLYRVQSSSIKPSSNDGNMKTITLTNLLSIPRTSRASPSLSVIVHLSHSRSAAYTQLTRSSIRCSFAVLNIWGLLTLRWFWLTCRGLFLWIHSISSLRLEPVLSCHWPGNM